MSKSFKTFLKHTAKDFHNQSVNPPVVRASTIIFKSMQHIRKTQLKAKKNPTGGFYDYGRQGTSTTYILQKILTKLEESYHVFTTPTGFGSVFLAIFSIVRPGDEMIVADPVYSPTRILTQDYLKEFNINTVFYNPHDLKSLEKNISKKTKLIFVENPGSNSFEFQDLGKIISIAKKNKILTAIDNTWATPYYFKPIKFGFDMSIVSATKYYSGHSDVMGGSLAVNKKVFSKVYSLGISTIIVEGGKSLTRTLLKNKLINEFYLFKSNKNLKKLEKNNIFNFKKEINHFFKKKENIKTFLNGEELIRYF